MFITKRHLTRRTFLHGMGATVALPLLESMIPAATPLAQSAPRTRLGCIYIPHGATMDKWTPAKEGTGFELTEILQPLKPLQDHINIISDLSHPQAYGGGSATANHNRSAATFLSGAHAKAGAQAYLGVTMDQFAARQMGQDTPLPSIELMIEDASLSCGSEGLSCAYRDTISWQGPTSPLPMQNDPQVVFERLFGDGSTDAQRRSRRQQSLSLLDSVLGEAASLQRTLPAGDRTRVDQYLSDVREIERRVQKAAKQASADVTLPDQPTGIPKDVDEHIKLMFDLQVLAWQADITRITTLLMAKELSNAVYAKSGVRDAFHILSHHSNIRENQDRFAVLNRYHVGLLVYLLTKLNAIQIGRAHV